MRPFARAIRGYPGAVALSPTDKRIRSVRRRLYAAWGLLFFNTMTYVPGISMLHLPAKVGKAFPQAALPLAILVLLTVNPKVKLRPNVFLCIVSLLAAETMFTAVEVHHLGTAYRTFRLAEFVAALWLLTPWWGRDDMLLLRVHLRWLYVVLTVVLVGLVISPGRALSYNGRLTGVLWPMMPTQIAQYAAVAAGLTVVLWLDHRVSGRATLAGVAATVVILLLSHTRTALVGLATGILIAILSLFLINSRARRFFVVVAVAMCAGALTLAGIVTTWLVRGQSVEGLTSLTGRTDFWALVLNLPRTRFEEIFGFGLSNASINGLPIDSNWLSAYLQEGLAGVVICAAILVFLILAAFFQSSGVRRALALFILAYCLLASFTEDSFSDASSYLLYLAVAASLIMAVRPRPSAAPAAGSKRVPAPAELAGVDR
ncbi:MAG: O-antigen ligase family protein [Trebonia sp.]